MGSFDDRGIMRKTWFRLVLLGVKGGGGRGPRLLLGVYEVGYIYGGIL